MGIAASSALRDDTGANGPAYGSLEALGGPRKFKKKPVLVLAPEELEAAHALFHEASAQLLGEDVERAPRPVSILGLAPMDNDPEDLGHSDELADDVEDDMPSPEAVLALTRRKSAALPDDFSDAEFADEGFGTFDGGADFGEYGGENDLNGDGLIDDGLPDDGFINDGLDLSTRIFPSLPIRPELALEDGESLPAMPVTPVTPVEQAAPEAEAQAGSEAGPEAGSEAEAQAGPEAGPMLSPPSFVFRPAPPSPLAAVAPTPAAPTLPPIEASEPPFSGPAPEPEFEPQPESETPPDLAQGAAPRPARFDELNPAKDYETPEDVLDLDRWLAGPAEDAAVPGFDLDAETPAGDAEPAAPARDGGADDADGETQGYTVTADDRVDGYAFMRDARPRHAVLSVAQEGRQSALRAKLLSESEREAARLLAQQQAPAGCSLAARLWHWLRDLFA